MGFTWALARKVVYDFQVRNYRVLKLDEMSKLDYKKYSIDGKEYEPVTIYDAQNCIAIESREEFVGKIVKFI